MSRDSKLGMLAGVLGVILIAVVYHQKAATAGPEQVQTTPAPVKPQMSTPVADQK